MSYRNTLSHSLIDSNDGILTRQVWIPFWNRNVLLYNALLLRSGYDLMMVYSLAMDVTYIYGAAPNLTLGDRLPWVSCQIYIQVECYCYLLLYFQVSRGDKTLFTSALIILCWLYSYMLVHVCMSCLVFTLIQSTIVLVRGFMIGPRSTTDKIWNAVSACLLHFSYFTKLDGYLLITRAVVTDYNIVIESKNIRWW